MCLMIEMAVWNSCQVLEILFLLSFKLFLDAFKYEGIIFVFCTTIDDCLCAVD